MYMLCLYALIDILVRPILTLCLAITQVRQECAPDHQALEDTEGLVLAQPVASLTHKALGLQGQARQGVVGALPPTGVELRVAGGDNSLVL